MEGQYIFVEVREITRKSDGGKFRVVKLVSPIDYSAFEAILGRNVQVPADIKRGSVCTVKVNLSQQGYRLSAVVVDIKKVA